MAYINKEKAQAFLRLDCLPKYPASFANGLFAAADQLANMPAADVAEVVHGEWIDKFNGKFVNPTYICSFCGEKALLECYINELDQWGYRQSLSIFCPHCGAKMDGKEG